MSSRLLILMGIAVMSGCAAVVSVDGTRMPLRSPEFAEYVEETFRFQNEVASDLAFALDDEAEESARYQVLDAAEAGLLEACDGLNALAIANSREGGRGGFGALRAARSAPECELAAREARVLLDGN